MLLKLFCELVFVHDWTAWASDAPGVWSRATAEKKRLAEIARHDDECGFLWELALAVFDVGANSPDVQAVYDLHEFLDVWDIQVEAATNWRRQSYRALHPTPPIDPTDDNYWLPINDGVPF